MTNAESTCNQSRENAGSDIAADGANMTNAESTCNQSREISESDLAVDGAQGSGDARNQAQLYQESSILYHFRDMQRRQIEFIKKKVLLLEKGLNAEYLKEYFGDPKANEVTNEELRSEPKTTNVPSYILGETDTKMIDQLPQVEAIASEEISIAACGNDSNRLESVRLYNEMCKVVEENTMDLVRTSLAREPTEVNVIKNFHKLETICEDVNRILSPTTKSTFCREANTKF